MVQGLEGNLAVPVMDGLTWSTNATYMIESKDKRPNQPLSLIRNTRSPRWTGPRRKADADPLRHPLRQDGVPHPDRHHRRRR
ncbi:hypothetical protein V6L77_01520 [Pannonibacter sp. Pt2-lr]